MSLSTVNRELCGITRMLRRNGLNVPKPMARYGRKTKHRPFSNDELVRFFSHCNPAQWLLFKIMLITGARPAELVPSQRSSHKALLKEDLDRENCIITIRTAKLKTGQDEMVRRFRIDGELMERLLQYANSITGSHVFPARNGSLHTTFDQILADAEIPKVDVRGRKLTAHSLRHTFATKMAQAEGDIFSVQQALGHPKPTTTSIYCHGSQTPVIVNISEVKGIRDGYPEERATGTWTS